MSSSSRARRSGGGGCGGGRQFPVGGAGRWRHVAVVEYAGCGCRPRRPRQLLMSLPSFLRPSPKPPRPAVRRTSSGSRSGSSSSFFPSSASTASSSAATFSSYSSSSYYYQHQEPVPQYEVTTKATSVTAPVGRKKVSKARKRREKMEMVAAEAEAEEEVDVGVAVEKESSDPRADFRESMVQMVVEMGLCDWDGLRSMLRRLLALNAPRHHAAILAAFAEVCAQLTSAAAPPAPPPPPTPPPAYQYHYDDYYY